MTSITMKKIFAVFAIVTTVLVATPVTMAELSAEENADEYKESLLIKAVTANDAETVDMLLKGGVSPKFIYNNKYKDSDSPLRLAIKHQHVKIVSILLENGADPNGLDLQEKILQEKINKGRITRKSLRTYLSYFDFIPLSQAVEKDNAEIVKLLLKYGADPSVKSAGGTLLERAINNVNADIVAALLKAKVELTTSPSNGYTSYLVMAMKRGKGDIDIIKLLLEAGAYPNAKTTNYYDLAVDRVPWDRPDILRLLLEYGGISSRHVLSDYPGSQVCPDLADQLKQEYVETYKILREHGCCTSSSNEKGYIKGKGKWCNNKASSSNIILHHDKLDRLSPSHINRIYIKKHLSP